MILATLLLGLVAPVLAAASADDLSARDAALRALVDRAFPDGGAPVDVAGPGSRAGMLEVLGSDLFLHDDVGPFDVFVMQADALDTKSRAARVLREAVEGLEPAVPVLRRFFGGGTALVAGRRFPILIADSDRSSGQEGFDQLVALLDWAEDDDTGWKASGNPVFDDERRAAETVRTWEVQLFNLGHPTAVDQGPAFLAHGVGYYSLAHVAARVMRQGAWGLVPPWLAQGLIDELDISAYGEAWVGGDWWERQTAGWFRPGWSGFVPQGMSPPPPVTGPPADLAVTVKDTGDSWQHRTNSTVRHWKELVADRDSQAPASFLFMARNESFLPRDRALARCLLHLMLHVAPSEEGLLTELLDRVSVTPPSGMPDAEPITVVFARALGGVPAVDAFEALPTDAALQEAGHPEVAKQIDALGGGELLALTDHRSQAEWLYRKPIEELDWAERNELWRLILEAEYYQQLHEWVLIGEALDAAMDAALAASEDFPERAPTQKRVAAAFRAALAD